MDPSTSDDRSFISELKDLDADDRPMLDQESAKRIIRTFKMVNF